MRSLRFAYTLIELLVVLGIIALLAGILLPVFVSAKRSSDRVSCLSHQRVISQAGLMYVDDYDDHYTITNQNTQEPRSSSNDHTWVQLLLPYANHFGIFRCPSDDGRRDQDSLMFDQDLVPGDLTSRYYTASMRSDSGLNYLALAPQVLVNGVWVNEPRTSSDIATPSNTVMFVDSAWAVDQDGNPYGGGNWLVDPPCRYVNSGGKLYDIFAVSAFPNSPVFSASGGWHNTTPFGGAYPWHQGRMNVTRVDGSATSITTDQLSSGCIMNGTSSGQLDAATGNYIWSSVSLAR